MSIFIERGKWKDKNIEEIKRDWNRRGFSCDIWEDPPGRRWENFVHETDELVTPLNAAIEIECEGETAKLNPGDEWFIPKGSVHSVRNKSDRKAIWLYGYKVK
jgi:uncharacterized cupin superfamily protein